MAKRHGAEFWREHLDAWHQSDLTQKAYCANNGLGAKAFYRWHRKDKEALAAAKATLTLIPTHLGAPVPVANNVIQLHSPGGWRIELPATNAPWLPDLLRQLP